MRLRITKARAAKLAASLVALTCAGYAVWWWQAASAVERGLHAWIEQRRAEGALVEHGRLTVDGFPLSLRAALEAPRFATRGLEWQGPRLIAEALPWRVTQVALSLPGEHRLTVAQPGQPAFDLLVRGGGTGQATWGFGGAMEQLRLTFTDLIAQPALMPVQVATLDLTASQPAHSLQQGGSDGKAASLSLNLTAAGVTLPEEAPQPLGRQMQRAVLSARVMGQPPRPEPASLSAWSRDGGTVELDRLALDWGPLRVALAGTLALDRELQPQAALTAEVMGAQAALTAIQPMLRPNEVKMARTVLGMLGRPTGPGGEQMITAPVTVQDRSLFLGPLKVAAVPLVTW